MDKFAAPAASPLPFPRPGSRFGGLPPQDTSCVLCKTLKESCSATYMVPERPGSGPHGARLRPLLPFSRGLLCVSVSKTDGQPWKFLFSQRISLPGHGLDIVWPWVSSAVAAEKEPMRSLPNQRFFLSFWNPSCVLQPDSKQESSETIAWADPPFASSALARSRIASLAPLAHSVRWEGVGRRGQVSKSPLSLFRPEAGLATGRRRE